MKRKAKRNARKKKLDKAVIQNLLFGSSDSELSELSNNGEDLKLSLSSSEAEEREASSSNTSFLPLASFHLQKSDMEKKATLKGGREKDKRGKNGTLQKTTVKVKEPNKQWEGKKGKMHAIKELKSFILKEEENDDAPIPDTKDKQANMSKENKKPSVSKRKKTQDPKELKGNKKLEYKHDTHDGDLPHSESLMKNRKSKKTSHLETPPITDEGLGRQNAETETRNKKKTTSGNNIKDTGPQAKADIEKNEKSLNKSNALPLKIRLLSPVTKKASDNQPEEEEVSSLTKIKLKLGKNKASSSMNTETKEEDKAIHSKSSTKIGTKGKRIKLKFTEGRKSLGEHEHTEDDQTIKTKSVMLKLKRINDLQPFKEENSEHTHKSKDLAEPLLPEFHDIKSLNAYLVGQMRLFEAPEDGHNCSAIFQTLPSRKKFPDYYEIISQPLSFHCIERKLETNEILNTQELKAAYMTLFDNAKKYNIEDSWVYKDANMLQKWIIKTFDKVKIIEKAPVDELDEQKKEEIMIVEEEAKAPSKKKIKLVKEPEESFPVKDNETMPPTTPRLPKGTKEDIQKIFKAIHSQDMTLLMDVFQSKKIDVNKAYLSELNGISSQWAFLHCASFYGSNNALIYLADELKAEIEILDPMYESTALGWACFGGQYETSLLLVLRYGAKLNIKNIHGSVLLDLVPVQSNELTQWKKLLEIPYDWMSFGTHKMERIVNTVSELSQEIRELFEELPSKTYYPDYYSIVKAPICLSMIREKIEKRKKLEHRGLKEEAEKIYDFEDGLIADFKRLIENAKLYNEPGSTVVKDAEQIGMTVERLSGRYLLETTAQEGELRLPGTSYKRKHMKKSHHGPSEPAIDEESQSEAESKLDVLKEKNALPEITYDGKTYRPGEFVLLKNPAPVDGSVEPVEEGSGKPILLHIANIWWYGTQDHIMLSGSWFVWPEQTFHHPTRLFYENEVFRMKKNHDHPVSDVLRRAMVLHVPDYKKAKPLLDDVADENIYVCEFKYSEWGKSMTRIKNWHKVLKLVPEISQWKEWSKEEIVRLCQRNVKSMFYQSDYTAGSSGSLSQIEEKPLLSSTTNLIQKRGRGRKPKDKSIGGVNVRSDEALERSKEILMNLPTDVNGEFMNVPSLIKGKTMKKALKLLSKLPREEQDSLLRESRQGGFTSISQAERLRTGLENLSFGPGTEPPSHKKQPLPNLIQTSVNTGYSSYQQPMMTGYYPPYYQQPSGIYPINANTAFMQQQQQQQQQQLLGMYQNRFGLSSYSNLSFSQPSTGLASQLPLSQHQQQQQQIRAGVHLGATLPLLRKEEKKPSQPTMAKSLLPMTPAPHTPMATTVSTTDYGTMPKVIPSDDIPVDCKLKYIKLSSGDPEVDAVKPYYLCLLTKAPYSELIHLPFGVSSISISFGLSNSHSNTTTTTAAAAIEEVNDPTKESQLPLPVQANRGKRRKFSFHNEETRYVPLVFNNMNRIYPLPLNDNSIGAETAVGSGSSSGGPTLMSMAGLPNQAGTLSESEWNRLLSEQKYHIPLKRDTLNHIELFIARVSINDKVVPSLDASSQISLSYQLFIDC